MTTMFIWLIILLVLFQIKHYVVDFKIQLDDPNNMRKFDSHNWVLPLLKHANQHAVGSTAIALVFLVSNGMNEWYHALVLPSIYLFDLIVHFSMDRIKASPNLLGRFKYPSKEYFRSLGLDQAVHHLTHYAIILTLLYFL